MTTYRLIFALLITAQVYARMVSAEEDGHHHEEESSSWSIDAETAARSGLTYEKAGPGVIRTTLALNGRLRFNEDKVSHLTARFPGVVKEVNNRLGDRVQRDDILATIESNLNLQRYHIKAPFEGVIVKKHASIGEYVEEKADIFMVAALSELWADLYVFPQDFDKVKVGQTVTISISEKRLTLQSKISFISSVVDELTQAKFARCVVENPHDNLFPGQFVTGIIQITRVEVPVVVKSTALQTLGRELVVFSVDRASGEVKPLHVETGRNDGEFTEVRNGLEPGTDYFAGDTLILRAESQKGEFKHEH